MTEERVSVPNIGDAHDVAVVEVLVQPGAKVEREQPLVVLESDKASMEIPSPRAGVVRKLEVKVGDTVSEGSPLLVLEVDGEGAAEKPAPAQEKPAAEKAEKPAAKKTNGGEAQQREAAPQPKAAKAATPAPASGNGQSAGGQQEPALTEVVDQLEPARGPEAAPSPPPAEAAADAEAPATRTIPPAPPLSSIPPKVPSGLPHASPAIRKFARELGVDLGQVPGSGPHSRITKEDVQGFVKRSLSNGGGSGVGLAVAEAPEIDFSKFGEISVQALTKIQKVSGKNLHRSWVTVPHVTQFDSADITELEEFRKKLKVQQPDLKITMVTFFMKAMSVAVQAMPRFNSSLDKSGENLILKRYVHIGVAVDTPNGLVVPVIRDVDKKSLSELAKELEEVSGRARARKLMPNDFQGASITISSLGGIGGTAFTPIINHPEVAVLGVSRAQWQPVYDGTTFVPRLMCPLSLSYDHRVIDGADAARFTKKLGELLADIRMLLV
ncbi:MAG TPA: 2-oxo acid dehydrogenase subunit E2 [Polyangiales bacterium]|nr:2-oxo acid dehydrogenase subunit E2 [Polyangiales bacterium]